LIAGKPGTLPGLVDDDFSGATGAVVATSGRAGLLPASPLSTDLPFDTLRVASLAGRGRGGGGAIAGRTDRCCGGSTNPSTSAGSAVGAPIREGGVSTDGGMASAEASPLDGVGVPGGREVSGP
jgi:hypothetical protein